MPKIPSIPRLSIIVPVGNDVSAFEDTLLSVLENQPAGSEVLVAHDGSYDDPFDLSGEVRFVTAQSCQQVDLVAMATERCRGRFIHVLSSGLNATADWADTALEQFERQETAVVAPVIRNAKRGDIVAAGWSDRAVRLCHPIAAGEANVNRSDAAKIIGAYLQASFWRRDILCGLISAFQSGSTVEATYAYGRMLIAGNWCCSLAIASQVVMHHHVDLSGPSSYSRGQRLWAIKKAIDPATVKVSWARLLGGLFGPVGLAETLGQIQGSQALSSVQSQVDLQAVPYHSDHGVVQSPWCGHQAERRAA